jgi:hypothetical protein
MAGRERSDRHASQTASIGGSDRWKNRAHCGNGDGRLGPGRAATARAALGATSTTPERSSQARPRTPGDRHDDIVQRLQDLAALRESGALSDKEFAAAKAKVLHR